MLTTTLYVLTKDKKPSLFRVLITFLVAMPLAIVFLCGVPALAIAGIMSLFTGSFSWGAVIGMTALFDILWGLSNIRKLSEAVKDGI